MWSADARCGNGCLLDWEVDWEKRVRRVQRRRSETEGERNGGDETIETMIGEIIIIIRVTIEADETIDEAIIVIEEMIIEEADVIGMFVE